MTLPTGEKRALITASAGDFRGIVFLTTEAIFVHEVARMRSLKYHYVPNLDNQWELPGKLRFHTFDSIGEVNLTANLLTCAANQMSTSPTRCQSRILR